MYCTQCNCEYSGWKGKCPVCQTWLLEVQPKAIEIKSSPTDYNSLVEEVRNLGGSITIEIETTDIETKRGRRMPYIGRGYAWVKTMSEECGEKLKATLTIGDVQKHKQWVFPYFGFGFAWANAGKLTLTLG